MLYKFGELEKVTDPWSSLKFHCYFSSFLSTVLEVKFKSKVFYKGNINDQNVLCRLQPRESKLRTKDNAQAHKSSSEFEIAALL